MYSVLAVYELSDPLCPLDMSVSLINNSPLALGPAESHQNG